jgi:hypothetical protein
MAVSGTDAITITATGAPALAADLNNHVGSEVLSADGVHGIRSILDGENYNLQVKVNDEWVNASGSKYTASITPASDDVTISGFSGDAETVTLTVVGDGIVTATSGDDSIATVSLNGSTLTITSVAAGSTTITLSMPETAQYTAATATINVVCNVITIGNTYFFGGFYWTAAEDLGNNAVCLQSQGMTTGYWPGYKLESDYTGAKSYGNANTDYAGNIDGDNIANYDEVTQAWYTKYASVEKTGQAYGSGLFLVSNSKCNQTTVGQKGSGNYWAGLKEAAINGTVLGAAAQSAYLGTNNGSSLVWFVYRNGNLSNDASQNGNSVIAPAFNLDLTKVKLIPGTSTIPDSLILLDESMPEIVTWASGTDAQVGNMIDAANEGIIDLSKYWSVGETREITVGAFTDNMSISHAQQPLDVVISQISPYNGIGHCQFDFAENLAEKQPMSATATNVGGYDATNVYTSTLPAMYNVMPNWIKSRMKTFSVKASAGNQSSTIETIENNKLALRSEIEYVGSTDYSFAGEGSQIELYKTVSNRIKPLGKGGSPFYSWTRSPNKNNSTMFTVLLTDGRPDQGNVASIPHAISPFFVM